MATTTEKDDRRAAVPSNGAAVESPEKTSALNMSVGEILQVSATLKELQAVFAPQSAPQTAHRTRSHPSADSHQDFQDDDLDALISPDAPDYWEVRAKRAEARQRRDVALGKKERGRMWLVMMLCNFGATMALNLMFNWSTTMWWIDQNIRPRVDSFGFETYVDDFDHWTAAEEALVQLRKEKAEIDAELDSGTSDQTLRASRKRKSEELFDVIKTLESNVAHYGGKLEARNKQYGHQVTPEYMIEQAERRRGMIIEQLDSLSH